MDDELSVNAMAGAVIATKKAAKRASEGQGGCADNLVGKGAKKSKVKAPVNQAKEAAQRVTPTKKRKKSKR